MMQADYALFICGAAAMIVAAGCFLQPPALGKGWRRLAVFALLQGCANWLSLFTWSLEETTLLSQIVMACAALSYLGMADFGRLFWRGRIEASDKAAKKSAVFIAVLLAGYTLVQLFEVGAAGFSQLVLTTGSAPVTLALVMKTAILGALALLCLPAVPAQAGGDARSEKGFRLSLAVALFALLFTGWLATGVIARDTDGELREDLRQKAEIAAVAIRPELAVRFEDFMGSGSREYYNYANPELQAIRRADPEIKWLYVVTRWRDEVVFAYSSQPAGQYDENEPGRKYRKYPPELLETLTSGRPATAGPYTDEWGTFVSGFAGIRDRNSGQIISVLGMDIDAGDWQRTVFRHRLAPVCITMLLFLLGLLYYVNRQRLLEAGERTAASEQRFALAMQGANDGLWDWNLVTDEVYYSPRWKSMLGFAPHEIGSSPQEWVRLLHPEDRDQVLDQLRAYLKEGGERLEHELRLRHKDGRYLDIQEKAFTVRKSSDGATIRMVGTQIDVTEKNAAARALQQAKAQAERAANVRRAFLANMSHEIRTPINAILGFTQLLMQETGLTQEQRENLSAIRRSGEHLLAVINEILEMSKLEAAKIILHEETFALTEFLDEVGSLFSAQMREKRLLFSCGDRGGLPRHVKADKQKLRQILLNLLGNAVKFTGAGSIEVSAGVEEAAAGDEALRLVWEVRDTGPGIAAEDLDRIFQPFIQVASGTQSGGTGLGLAISREYARLMGGDVTVVSRVGEGSVFRLEVPVQAAAVENELRSEPGEGGDKTNATGTGARAEEILPAELAGELRDAVLRARVDECTVLIGRMQGDYPVTAAQLQELLTRFEYEKILELLKKD